MSEETFEEGATPAPKKGKGKPVEAAAEAAPVEKKKPFGQNPGDVVPEADAVGGKYKSVGAGMMERLPD